MSLKKETKANPRQALRRTMANPRRRGGCLFGGAGGRRLFCYFSMLFEEEDSCPCMCLMFIGSTSACGHVMTWRCCKKWRLYLCANKFWDVTFHEEKIFTIKACAIEVVEESKESLMSQSHSMCQLTYRMMFPPCWPAWNDYLNGVIHVLLTYCHI